MSVRTPCLPPTADFNRTDGNCRWCNDPLPRNKDGSISRARFWHRGCKVIARPVLIGTTNMLHWLAQERGWRCVDCGDERPTTTLEVDHERPLWSVDRTDPEAWRFWMAENLALRCVDCHKVKTKREAKARAKCKRLNGTTKGPRFKQKIPSRGFQKPPPGHQYRWPSRKVGA